MYWTIFTRGGMQFALELLPITEQQMQCLVTDGEAPGVPIYHCRGHVWPAPAKGFRVLKEVQPEEVT